MTARFSTDLHRAGLKTHVRRLIQMLGGIEAASVCTRVHRSKVAEYADPNLPDRHAPIDVLLDLELAAGTPLVTQQLAAMQSYGIIPLDLGHGDVAEALARVSRDAGTTLSDAMAALRDGLPDAQRARLVADLTELTQAANAALCALAAPSQAAKPTLVVGAPHQGSSGSRQPAPPTPPPVSLSKPRLG